MWNKLSDKSMCFEIKWDINTTKKEKFNYDITNITKHINDCLYRFVSKGWKTISFPNNIYLPTK